MAYLGDITRGLHLRTAIDYFFQIKLFTFQPIVPLHCDPNRTELLLLFPPIRFVFSLATK